MSEEVRQASLAIIDQLPDDALIALTTLAMTLANVAIAAEADEEATIRAVRAAFREFRGESGRIQ